ncbi:MAG: folate-binding protein [Betaproteobacteria bacterium]
MTSPTPIPIPIPATAANSTDGGRESVLVCTAPELGILDFTGPDAESFLQGQLSSDLKALVPGSVQLSSYNSPKGRMLATLMLWREGAESIRALVPPDVAEYLRKRLGMYVMRAKLVVVDTTSMHMLFGIAGAGASSTATQVFGCSPDRGQVLVGETKTLLGLPDGRIVVLLPAATDDSRVAQLAARATAITPEYWRWLGIRAGVPTIGAATQDLFVLQTANWDLLDGVSFQKGCYPGQEIVARTQYLGRLKERMQLFHVDGPPPPPATKLYGNVYGDQACGTVVDAAPAPEGGADLLAVVQLSALDGPLRVGTPDGSAVALLPLPYAIPAPAKVNRPKL